MVLHYPEVTPLRLFFAINLREKLFGLLLLLLISACAVVVQPASQSVARSGNFELFLQPLPQETHRLTFNIENLVALREDGSEINLILQQPTFVADNLISVQKRLINTTLPPGRYLGVALQIAAVNLRGEDGPVELLPPKDRLVAEYSFIIEDKQAETLFLSLSAERVVTDGVLFTPKFSLWKPERLLTNLKGFASNVDSQSLTVFDKRTAQVVGHIRVGNKPTALALDQQRNWLYVALAGENAVAVVEVANGSILGRVPLRFGDKPVDLVLTRDGSTLLTLNRGSESVSIIDTSSLFETGRVRLLSEPSGIFLGHDDMRAYITHAVSGSLSVLDLQSQSLRGTVSLEESPLDGVSSSDGRSLYVINDFSADLSVLDSASLRVRDKIYIGNGAVYIRADHSNGLLYITKKTGEIAVVDPRSLMAIDNYAVGEPAQQLTIDNEENAMFVVLPESRQLIKIDLVSKRELGRLELNTGSGAVVVMGER